MACRLFGSKPLSKPMLGYYQFDPWSELQWYFNKKNTKIFIHENTSEDIVCEMMAIFAGRGFVYQLPPKLVGKI